MPTWIIIRTRLPENAFEYLGTEEQYDGTEQAIVGYVCLKGTEVRELSKGKN